MANGNPDTEYRGKPILKHSLAMRGASADAMSGSLKVKPQNFTQGVPVYAVVELMPGPEHHEPMNDGDAWELVHITKLTRCAVVPADVAKPYLDELDVKIEALREEETGQARLAIEEEAERLAREHEQGMHKRRRPKCRLCNPSTDEDRARLEAYEAKGAPHGDGEGDEHNELQAARKRRGGKRQ